MNEKLGKMLVVTMTGIILTLALFNINNKILIVTGESMQPTLYQGNVRVCRKRPKKIKIGDILAYRIDGKSIVHRVVEINKYADVTYYITKGDNNDTVDFIPITKEQIYCKVVK